MICVIKTVPDSPWNEGNLSVQPPSTRVWSIYDSGNEEEYVATISCDLHPQEYVPASVTAVLPEMTWPDLTKACETPFPARGDTDEGLDRFVAPPVEVHPEVIKFQQDARAKLKAEKYKKVKHKEEGRKEAKKARREQQTAEAKQIRRKKKECRHQAKEAAVTPLKPLPSSGASLT